MFIINLIPLHVLVLMLLGRCDLKVYVAYTTFIALGFILSMQIPFVGFLPVQTSEHMAAIGVFGLVQIYTFFKFALANIPKQIYYWITRQLFILVLLLSPIALFVLTYFGYVAPFSGRFYSLYDTGYAKIHIPIIASVSEHQPTAWPHFFMDLHVLSCFFPAGLWFVFKRMTNERVFLILYAVSSVYFAGVMVRLILTLTPIVVVLASIAFSHLLKTYINPGANAEAEADTKTKKSKASSNDVKSTEAASADATTADTQTDAKSEPVSEEAEKLKADKETLTKQAVKQNSYTVGIVLTVLLMLFSLHSTHITQSAYSSPSVVLASQQADGSRYIMDDFREAYFWLRQNTKEDATVMSWWDYGYQIAGFSNRTTLVDNNTWNNSHIAMVGMAMSSNESRAYEIMTSLGVNYVLVIFGGVTGYSGDDINKFLWMVRIAEGEHPEEIQEHTYFSENGEYRVDGQGSKRMLNCLMYKLCYYRFGEVASHGVRGSGYDRARGYEVGNKMVDLTYLEEAFTSEHWIVRIYRVKTEEELTNRGILKQDDDWTNRILQQQQMMQRGFGKGSGKPPGKSASGKGKKSN